MFQKNLSSLSALLGIKIKEKDIPNQVSAFSFAPLSSFFEVPQKTAPPPQKKEPMPQPYIKPKPAEKIALPLKQPQSLPQTLSEEPLISLIEQDKKFEKLIPIKKDLPYCDAAKTSTQFMKNEKPLYWGLLPFLPLHDKEDYLAFIDTISKAISSKLSIPVHLFDKNDTHCIVRIKAASNTMKVLLIFGEPHALEHAEKLFISLLNREQKWPSYPPLTYLGMVQEMALFYAPITLSMKEDIAAKKNLWLSLQQLARHTYDC
jgi:hypothetical protein